MLQDLLIRGGKRTDKRDNFVKLNRDHHQQFPHYIRARHPHNHKLAHNIFLIISNINVFIISAISSSPGSLSLLLHRIPKHLNHISEVPEPGVSEQVYIQLQADL